VTAKIIEKNSFEELNTGQIIFCGDGSDKCKDVINEKHNFTFLKDVYPDAKNMVEFANEKFKAKTFVDVNYFEPFYLKEYQSQAEFHKK
jgi:tRNA threonylcarbamoyladenosine biosynthesis protein TsaB